MSGTSADGVDVAIVRIGGRGLGMSAELVHHHHVAYEPSLRELIFAARGLQQQIGLSDLARMARQISLTYARAVSEALAAARLSARDLAAVAAHGQTLYHDPPHTIQWLDPALLAAEVGCAVVSDFRRADCAAGGQGAPLVPFADYILFRHPTKNRVLLNIGGVANLTWLRAGGTIDEVIAFDTGPGNCISDDLCRKHNPSGPGYDSAGQIALRGQVHRQTVLAFTQGPFVTRPPPRSTDGPAMIAEFERAKQWAGFNGSFEDELATACACCAQAVALSLELGERSWWRGWPDEILISGGGVNNRCLMDLLHQSLAGRATLVAMDPRMAQAKEAIAFALLAAATLDGVPSNVPSVTGARRAVVLGSITPKPWPV
ncbi:anhydro-N-acetylmuramic acid kinase [Fontivita pretiosa]|uniref:anhydro-N-acetylmuramic acid kinase n=1 Tax=Fontivita pretiosa TaxID=2989684 RepID=UPI003D1874FA